MKVCCVGVLSETGLGNLVIGSQIINYQLHHFGTEGVEESFWYCLEWTIGFI